MKKLKIRSVLILTVMMMPLVASCGDDDEKNGNNADIAITGSCTEVGEDYARIEGYFNQKNITASYSSLQVGIEYSTDESFKGSIFAQSKVIEGNRFKVEIKKLKPSTNYYYRTCVKINSLNYVGKTSTFTTKEKTEDDIEPDNVETITLKGTWTGYIGIYFYDRFGLSGDNYRTAMYFERESSNGGWGRELDYDVNNMYSEHYYCEFVWEASGGQIRIRYSDSWNNVYIYNYSLSESQFSGYMDDGTSRDIRFQLTYDNNFDWGYWTKNRSRL